MGVANPFYSNLIVIYVNFGDVWPSFIGMTNRSQNLFVLNDSYSISSNKAIHKQVGECLMGMPPPFARASDGIQIFCVFVPNQN